MVEKFIRNTDTSWQLNGYKNLDQHFVIDKLNDVNEDVIFNEDTSIR